MRMRTEYWMDGALLALFMISACVFSALLEHPASPVYQMISSPLSRRALAGAAMGFTAVALIYSPFGKRSGAHMNPSVTLSFWRLGKVSSWDAGGYIVSQFLGAVLGVAVMLPFIGRYLADPHVHFAATLPGRSGVGMAWLAEFGISFLLMSMVLRTAVHPALNRWTGVIAGCFVALYITLEAPVSGMSMNPARSFGSAIFAHAWQAFWIYLTAPPLGMLAAAELSHRTQSAMPCAKLDHDSRYPCLFCKGR